MTRESTKLRRAVLKSLRVLAVLVVLFLLAAVALCLHAFRDRHSGYSLNLDIPANTPPTATPTLRVGFGRANIDPDLSNPDRPVFIAGFGQNRRATAIHDPLLALACVIDNGSTRLGVAAIDAIGFFHDDVIRVRQQLPGHLQLDFKEPTHAKARALGRNLASRILPVLEDTNAPSLTHFPMTIRARTLEIPVSNKGYLLAPVLGLIDRGHVRWKRIRTEVALLTLGDTSVACIPGEIYPELVNGGIEKAPGGDFDIEPLELPPIRDLMPGRIKFIFGLANDEIGYIIPKSEWDEQEPYIYGAKRSVYGEINSCGPEVASILHQTLRDLSRGARGARGARGEAP